MYYLCRLLCFYLAEGAEFKLRKSSDKAIVFQAKRKEGSSAKNTHRSRPVQRAPLPSGSPRQDSSSPASLPTPDEEDNSNGSTSSLSSLSSSPASNHSAYKPVIIPSAKTIKTARRQRQEARSQKDFISLGRDGRSSAGSTPDRRSRDSDRDDYEPDDCERRIEFAPRAKSVRERIAEKLGKGKVMGKLCHFRTLVP